LPTTFFSVLGTGGVGLLHPPDALPFPHGGRNRQQQFTSLKSQSSASPALETRLDTELTLAHERHRCALCIREDCLRSLPAACQRVPLVPEGPGHRGPDTRSKTRAPVSSSSNFRGCDSTGTNLHAGHMRAQVLWGWSWLRAFLEAHTQLSWKMLLVTRTQGSSTQGSKAFNNSVCLRVFDDLYGSVQWRDNEDIMVNF